MATTRRDARADLALAAFSCVGAALMFIGAADLAPARFEPLGSAALPRALGALMALFGAIIGWRALGALRRADADGAVELALPGRLFLVLAATAAYVVALDSYAVSYIAATVVFMVAIGAILAKRRPLTLLGFALLGAALAVAIRYVMTHFVYVDLG